MSNTFVPIYILRSRCKACKVDTMRTFTLKDNESPDEAYAQMERWVKQRFPKDHNCIHKIKFERMVDKDYRYNTKKKEVEKV